MQRILTKLRLVLAELARPDAMRDNWFVWAAGQGAHIAIGLVLAGGLLFVLPPSAAFFGTTLGYALLKELPDYLRSPGWAGARDCTQDALFVTAGAALAVGLRGGHDGVFFVVIGAAILGLSLGVYGRIRQ